MAQNLALVKRSENSVSHFQSLWYFVPLPLEFLFCLF